MAEVCNIPQKHETAESDESVSVWHIEARIQPVSIAME